MSLKALLPLFLTLISLVAVPKSNALAGPYTNALTKCVITSTTKTDREQLIKWMFSAISRHPIVQGMTSISKAQMDDTSKKTAKIFERLMAEDCVKQTKEAVQYEGSIAIGKSFSLLGQVAAKEIFQNKKVVTAISDLNKYFDEKKLQKNIRNVK